MKKLAVLFGFVMLVTAELALANAVVTNLTGSVQARSGSAPVRTVRQGDTLVQGDTVTTGPASSIVMRFEDGQVAALAANSSMTISTYNFDRANQRGNILLSLLNGGMRAVTGLIGRNSPQQVSYKAASATIGIRGSDGSIATSQGQVGLVMNDGSFTFTMGDKTVTVDAGGAVNALPDGTFSQGAINQIMQELQRTSAGQQIFQALGGLSGLTTLIQQATGGGPGVGTQTQPTGPAIAPGLGSGGGTGGQSAR